jgi:hypothetical protein
LANSSAEIRHSWLSREDSSTKNKNLRYQEKMVLQKINFWLPIEVSSAEKNSWLPREDNSAENRHSWLPRKDSSAKINFWLIFLQKIDTLGYQEKIVLQKIKKGAA